MPKFRKRPVEVDAFQFKGWTSAAGYMPSWFWEDSREKWAALGANIYLRDPAQRLVPREDIAVVIETLEGSMRADQGDWIVKGVKGELYPVKPDIFAETYESLPTDEG